MGSRGCVWLPPTPPPPRCEDLYSGAGLMGCPDGGTDVPARWEHFCVMEVPCAYSRVVLRLWIASWAVRQAGFSVSWGNRGQRAARQAEGRPAGSCVRAGRHECGSAHVVICAVYVRCPRRYLKPSLGIAVSGGKKDEDGATKIHPKTAGGGGEGWCRVDEPTRDMSIPPEQANGWGFLYCKRTLARSS